MKLEIQITDTPSQEDIQVITRGLIEYNESKVGPGNLCDLVIFVRDEHGNILGGLKGYTYLDWLSISHLWVAENLRGQGIGTRILKMAEAEAVKRGCHHCHLDTFDFQARGFYEKHGYSVFGVLEDYPAGHKRYFLQKRNLDHHQNSDIMSV